MKKYVFAHFMVGNTFPYTIQDWSNDIELAYRANIDGFALNVGREPWQIDRVADCFSAATHTDVPFYFFLSFDMSSIPSESKGDLHLLCSYLERFGKSERMFRYKHGILVSTFAGENSLFGQPNLDSAWTLAKERLASASQSPIHYVPSLFIDPALYREMECLDGVFNWNGGWPVHLNSDSSRREMECPALDGDNDHVRNLQGRTFMSAVSPWFFTHYGVESWNKNWIYRGDDWLFVRRWEHLIAMRDQVDMVQIISWNDYGESHYIGPIKGAQPNSQAWVDGFPHEAWLNLTTYFSRAFKDGKYPPIDKDKIFAWARPHTKAAVATDDSVSRPDNWNLTDDKLWAVVFAISPAMILMHRRDRMESVKVKKGYTKLSWPLEPGDGFKLLVERNGTVVAECSASEFRFEREPLVYNFNAFAASS